VQIISLRELEEEARRRLPPAYYDYFAGGADDEITMRANETAFGRIRLLPRVLRATGKPQIDLTLLGERLKTPVLIAPTAFHRLAHPEGECATARAAAAAGTIMIVSMASTVAIEEVAAAARETGIDGDPHLWFQLYLQPDRGFTKALAQRAEAAGCKTLVVTVDSPVFGHREREIRHGFHDLPPGMCCENLRETAPGAVPAAVRPIAFSSQFSWEDIDWLMNSTSLKIVLKGIVHPEDARLAVQSGVAAIMVSNHGGRQLDTVPSTIELLPAIADAVGGSVPLLLDGGIRRGTDAIKALALGASAVAIGRPVLWGLAAGGTEGVAQVLETLRTELERALALCGCSSLREVGPELLRFQPTEASCMLS
jgi:4-hydroxymandelate oxidase